MPEIQFPTEEEMVRQTEALVEHLWHHNHSLFMEYLEGYPAGPPGPGLYALVAPDGVTARVVEGRVARADLKRMIREDVTRRMLRPLYADLAASDNPPTYEELENRCFWRLLDLKRRYRLERLTDG